MERIFKLFVLLLLIFPSSSLADVKEIISEGTYNMGDGETPTVAESRALLQAKRVAIEQAGTYIESYSKVKSFQLTHDEIQVLASGVMEVTILGKKRTVVGDGINFWVKVNAKISTDKIDVLASRAKERRILEDYKRLQADLENTQREIEDLKKRLMEAKPGREKNQVKEIIGRNEKQFQSYELVGKGMKHFFDKDYDTAITTFKAVLEIDHDNAKAYPWIYGWIGIIYVVQGKDTQAIAYLNKAIEQHPKMVEFYVLRGGIYRDLQQYDKANLDFNTALGINENYPHAYLERGMTREKRGQYDQAIEDYSKAIFLDPNSQLAVRGRLLLYAKIGKYEEAIKDCERLIVLTPKDPLNFAMRGEVFEKRNQFDSAIEDYNKAIAVDPNYTLAYNRRGSAYFKKGEFRKAIEDFNKTISKQPADAFAYSGLGAAYYKLGNFSQSIINYKEAARLGDKGAQQWLSGINERGKEWFNKGLVHLRYKEYDQAIEAFTVVIAIDPNYLFAYGNRGIAYGAKGLHDKAIEDFTKVIALNPHDAVAYGTRAFNYYRKGQYDKAIEDFNKAMDITPNDFGIYDNRGYIYLDLGRLQFAERDFAKALELNDRLVDAYIGLAIVYFRQGKKEEAKNYYQKAIEIDPLCKGGGGALEKRNFHFTASHKKTINEILRLLPSE